MVRKNGPRVCVFFSNGTRRWFLSGIGEKQRDYFSTYVDASAKRLADIFQLFFEYGLDTLVVPVLSDDLSLRGEEYANLVVNSIPPFLNHPKLQRFYAEYQVRVRFFGEYLDWFKGEDREFLRDLFDTVSAQTQGNNSHRIFFGLYAGQPVDTLAALSAEYFRTHGAVPDHKALTKMYYGEEIPYANLFISSGKLYIADLPLIINAHTQLYYCIAPSFFISETQLREILFDFLFSRRTTPTNYEQLAPEDWREMTQFFKKNQDLTIGVGKQKVTWGLWYPSPETISPPGG